MHFIKQQSKSLSKISIRNKAKAVSSFIKEFCANSSIHGVRYFTERGLHWNERLWWITAFVVSVWMCANSIEIIWIDWLDDPILLSLTNKPKLISDIPFPNIIICPEAKAPMRVTNVTDLRYSFGDYTGKISDAYNSEQYMHREMNKVWSLFPDNFNEILALALICDLGFASSHYSIDGNEVIDNTIYDAMKNMSQGLNFIHVCGWKGGHIRNEEDCSQIITDHGVCLSLNSLKSVDIYTDEMAPELMTAESPNISGWSFENGYLSESDDDDFPLRSFSTRVHQGAHIKVMMIALEKNDSENVCAGITPGYRLYMNAPNEHPITSTFRGLGKFIPAQFSEDVLIKIRPTLTTTSDDLRSYDPNVRGCLFNSENHLRFFKTYTLNNCETECLANYTHAKCGCVKFSMPRNKSATPICGWAKVNCCQRAEDEFFSQDVIAGMQNGWTKSFRSQCNCMPSCTSISYEYDVSRSAMTSVGLEDMSIYTAEFRTFFGETKVTTYKRSARYSIANFLSNCGGLLGLFLGVSVLSIIEFIYYATLHLFWWIKKQKSKKNVMPIQQISQNISTIQLTSTLLKKDTFSLNTHK